MAINGAGAIRLSYDIGQELSEPKFGRVGLKQASAGEIETINTNNAVADRPDGSAPHLMSEFYSYDHSATSGPAIGDYGNSSSTIVWAGNQGNSSLVITDTFDLSSASLCGASVVGRTCHIYIRFASGTAYKQDAQLKGVRNATSGIYYAVGGTDATWGWAQWETTRRTTNTSYNHSSGWYDVTETNTSGRWSKDEYGTPSGSTGIDVGSTGCIYYEGSGSYAYSKHVYLRSKEFTIGSNTFIVRTHGYGANMGTLYFGVYLTN